MKTAPVHQCLETLTETDTVECVYQKPAKDINELKQHLIETWSATSRATLTKRLISGKIVLMHVSKPEANTEHFSVTVMTFKAYFTAVMNKLACFILQGRVIIDVRIGGQFCCSFVANLLENRVPKIMTCG